MNYSTAAAARARVSASLSAKAESRMTKSFQIDPLNDSRWEVFSNSHPRASVFHSTNWLRALQTAYRYEPVVITSCPGNAALTNGLVFCRVKSWLTGRRIVSLPFADHCEPLASNSEEIDNLLVDMREIVDAGKWKYLEIRPTSHRPATRTGLHETVTYRIHSLALDRSEEQLFDEFHKSCVQRKIRRAERERLRYEEGTSESLLRTFYRLLIVTRRRQYLPPQPLSWFRALIDAFGEKLKIRVAFKDDTPVASILTLSHKQSMVYKYGCSDARFHRFGGMPFLFWQAIQEAKHRGLDEFEMGRSTIDNPGLISFKEHWGAVGKPLSYWAYPRSPHRNQSIAEKAFLRCLVPVTPSFVLGTLGGFLYRHIG
jgi:hypothetical protein